MRGGVYFRVDLDFTDSLFDRMPDVGKKMTRRRKILFFLFILGKGRRKLESRSVERELWTSSSLFQAVRTPNLRALELE